MSASPVHKGLCFFSQGASPAHRRRRIGFVVVFVLVTSALIWPVYPVFAGAFPLLLGLPLSMAWVVGWLLFMFLALLGLYRNDGRGSHLA